MVKYCSVTCQKSHRPTHKKECKKRAAELHDEALFKQPPPRDDCPICFLELPFSGNKTTYKPCCGKILCDGCMYASAVDIDEGPCPFCREPMSRSIEEEKRRTEKRMEVNDPKAFVVMGLDYAMGEMGLPQDTAKAIELWRKAIELGSNDAHFCLGDFYFRGTGVELNRKKAKHHMEIAAIAAWLSGAYLKMIFITLMAKLPVIIIMRVTNNRSTNYSAPTTHCLHSRMI